MRRYANIGQPGGDRSANVVHDPTLHLAAGVECELALAPADEPVAGTRTKQLVTRGPVRNRGQNIERHSWQWQGVSTAVLGACRRNGPGAALEVELRPTHPAHLLAAAASEDQEPDDSAIVIVPACLPNADELIVRQHALACLPHNRNGRADHRI